MEISRSNVATGTGQAPLTVEGLLSLHPFPAEWAKEPRIERLWTFDLPCTPEAIWPYVADTSRMNRALGTAEMVFKEHGGKRYGSAKPGGVKHEWWEAPWNWVANQWLTCTRIYERGFMKALFAIHRVERTEAGCRLYLYFGTVPRGALGGMAITLGMPGLEKAYRRVLPALAEQLDRPRPEVLRLPPPPLELASEQRLRAQRDALITSGLNAACVDALFDWLRTGDDLDLHRIQIRERARAWQLDETELLSVALHATRAGLLTLSWDTVCPHCRGVRDENAALSELKARSHCEACQIDFDTDTPESVEVTFRVHSSIRDIADQVYCSAEPAKKDHIRVQWTLAPGASVKLDPQLKPGRYCMSRNRQRVWYLDIESAGAETVKWQAHPPGAVIKAVPAAPIEIVNDAPEAQTFTIAEARWSDYALRAAHLLTFQGFRDLFAEEYLGADVRLGVGQQTVLFTDVVGSTAFYATRGDPAAFIEIKRHFDELFAIVASFRGAVVKTIGDAVMATFVQPVDALRAAQKIHQSFHPERTDTPIRLRIALNTGPCIAVRLNANIDFFGGTVNVAAKLQSLAEEHQIAMSDATYMAPGVAEFLSEQRAELERLEYRSKALPEPVGARRWSVFRG